MHKKYSTKKTAGDGKKNNEFDTGIIIFTILQVPCPLLKNHTKGGIICKSISKIKSITHKSIAKIMINYDYNFPY